MILTFKPKNRIRQSGSFLDDSIQSRAKSATLTGQVFCRAGVAFLFYLRTYFNVDTLFFTEIAKPSGREEAEQKYRG